MHRLHYRPTSQSRKTDPESGGGTGSGSGALGASALSAVVGGQGRQQKARGDLKYGCLSADIEGVRTPPGRGSEVAQCLPRLGPGCGCGPLTWQEPRAGLAGDGDQARDTGEEVRSLWSPLVENPCLAVCLCRFQASTSPHLSRGKQACRRGSRLPRAPSALWGQGWGAAGRQGSVGLTRCVGSLSLS